MVRTLSGMLPDLIATAVSSTCRRRLACGLLICLAAWLGVADTVAEDAQWVAAPPHLNFTPLAVEGAAELGVVTTFAHDDDGYLWIGSQRGLRRYDGYALRADGLAGEAMGFLADAAIVASTLDGGGRLWIATREGRVYGYPAADQEPALLGTEASAEVTALLVDSRGIVWIGTRQGLEEVAPDGRRRRHRSRASLREEPVADPDEDDPDTDTGSEDAADTEPDDGEDDTAAASPEVVDSDACRLVDEHVTALLEDSQGALWVGSRGGLHRFDRVRSCFQAFRHHPDEPRSLASNHVTALLEDSQGTLWVGTADGGLDRTLGGDGNFLHLRPQQNDPLSLPDERVTVLFEDSQRQVWVGTARGLSRLEVSTHRFDRYIGLTARSHGLPSGSVRAIFEDRTGTLWLSMDGGVASLPALRRYFHHYREAGFGAAVDLRETVSIYEDLNRRLWVGTARQGLFVIDRTRRRTRYFHQPATDGSGDAMAVPALVGNGQGTVWIGTAGAGVWWRHPESRAAAEEILEPLPHNGRFPDVDRAFVQALAMEDEHLWIGTRSQGLLRFDGDRRRLEAWRHDTTPAGDEAAVPASNDITAVLPDSHGDVWVGFADAGFDRLRPSAEGGPRFERFGPQAVRLFGRHTSTVNALHEDAWGKIWVATEGGLLWFDRTLDRLQIEARLGSRAIKALVDDRQGNLWVSDEGGLWRLPMAAADGGEPLRIERFTVEHGLQGRSFADGAVFRGLGDEELFFGGEGGVNSFAPQLIVLERPAPPVVLSAVTVEGQLRDVSQGSWDLVLDSEERELRVEVAALDFVRPQDNQYAFFLEGEDRGWVETGDRRSIRYNRLRPGEYTLYVSAAHADGVWNRDGLQLGVRVEPKLRQRPLFQIAVALLVALGVGLLVLVWDRGRNRRQVRLRELEIEGKRRQLGAQEDERSRLAREIHEGALATLSSVTARLEGKSTLDGDEIRDSAEQLNGAAASLRDIGARLHSPVLGRFGLAAAIRERLARLGKERPRLEIQLDLAADGQRLSEAVRLVVFRVFEQALSNSLRHGDPSWIRVILELSATGCRLRLIDDGRGFRVPLKWVQLLRGKYQGLLDMVERAESVGGKCYIRSIPGRGTEVRVVAPFAAQRRRRRGRRR